MNSTRNSTFSVFLLLLVLTDVAAAIYVIDQEDIKNSGATTIVELLHRVPGLQVARISSNQWAITSRGFNGLFTNKLLVQIDRRSIYTSTYSGIYWSLQNIVLEDIERIEIIRGPGATLLGANAVNGVINVITRKTQDTLGELISAASRNHEKFIVTLRYGYNFENGISGKVCTSHHDAYDDSEITSGGFRMDGDIHQDNTWTLQGDLYTTEEKSSPRHQLVLLTAVAMSSKVHLNLQGCYIDGLSAASQTTLATDQSVDQHIELDANILWQILNNLKLKLVGQNLLDSQHLEFISESFTPETEIG